MGRKIFLQLILTSLVLLLSSCGGEKKKEMSQCELHGAGTTFPEPFYLMAFDTYETGNGNSVWYEDCGSKKGIIKLQKKTVDFAASDEFLTDGEMAKMKQVIHIPTCIIGTAITFNLPGISKLNLSGDVLADIYAGKITLWNDERIKALNRGIPLPAKNIIPIYRSGSRSITFIFTSYLSDVSEEWKNTHGPAMSISVPKGRSANNNADVVAKIKEIPYSIAYVGYEYAHVLNMPVASLKNANGEFVNPNTKSISITAFCDIPADTRTLLVNSPVKGAYPITGFSWIIIYQEQNYNNRTEEQARATVNLLKYMLSDNIQQSAKDIGFSPLPKSMAAKSLKNLKKVTYNGRYILR